MREATGIACIRTMRAGAPQLFLSHGVTDNAASLAAAHRHWRSDYDVTSIDARGHGVSSHFSPAELSDPIEVMVEDLITILEGRQHDTALILIGHSMGGAVSAAAAARRPDLVDALVLEDPAWLSESQRTAYSNDAPALATRMAWISDHPGEALTENRKNYPAWDVEESCAWLQGKIQVDRDFVSTGIVSPSTSWAETASALATPTLLVTSDGDDVLIGPSGLEKVEALGNTKIRTAVVPGASHCVRRDQSEGFYAVCDSFLKEVAS
ncbi:MULTISPECIES: alpha/beta fold hydrolase [Actinomyces]|uniref:Alpha/beta hydrolase n=1 Tax=Actinomyces respiraculi TaxID=2744574 RepID=A0A7T0LLR9_9ACTO|nr:MULTISPECIES: alpha/beta hydrolase [Actinomyces]QPL05942.1 alpha/beta hydrolase [Actinomyces respiraculi]